MHRCRTATVCGNAAVPRRDRPLAQSPRVRQPGSVSEALAVGRLRLRVRGVVQGVGFRPSCTGWPTATASRGFVLNDADGVVVEAEGEPGALAAFVAAITAEAPPLARWSSVDRDRLPAPLRARVRDRAQRGRGVEGGRRSSPRTPLPATTACASSSTPPIAATAIRSSTARTAARASRSSRPSRTTGARTTMAGFPLCAACRARVRGPRRPPLPRRADRLPRLRAPADDAARGGRRPAARRAGSWPSRDSAATTSPATRPTRTAVARLRARKHREEKPLAVMTTDSARPRRADGRRGRAPARPSHARSCSSGAGPARRVAPSVAPGSPWLGLMLPYTPLHHLLCHDVGRPAGADERQPLRRADRDRRRGRPRAAGRDRRRLPLPRPADPPPLRGLGRPRRRSRCDARAATRRGRCRSPSAATAPIVAAGAELKSTFCVARGAEAFLSPHLGDLDSEAAYARVPHRSRALPRHARRRARGDRLRPPPRLPVDEVGPRAGAAARRGAAPPRPRRGLPGRARRDRRRRWRSSSTAPGSGTDGTLWGGELLRCDLALVRADRPPRARAAARRRGRDPGAVAHGRRLPRAGRTAGAVRALVARAREPQGQRAAVVGRRTPVRRGGGAPRAA